MKTFISEASGELPFASLSTLPIGERFVISYPNGDKAEAEKIEESAIIISAYSDYPETEVCWERDRYSTYRWRAAA